MKKKNDNHSPRVVYYDDEMNDEFSTAVITPRRIDERYKYKRDRGFGKLVCFFWYRIVAVPLATLYLKIKFRHKIIGREKLALAKRQGIFVYGNHTQPTADALIPTFISRPRWAYVIVHPNNVSMPLLGRITPYMGALPLPDSLCAARNFNSTIKDRINEGKSVFIYPEAHIWPYFTGIRPFRDDSFSYPVKMNTPVFCFTNVYLKRKNPKKVKIVTYVDGPFYPNTDFSIKDARRSLRDEIFDAMLERSRLSDAVLVEYRKRPSDKKDEESDLKND